MRTAFLLLFFCLTLSASGQFTIRDASSTKPTKLAYDSSVNFDNLKCTYNLQTLVGQEFYFVPVNPKYEYGALSPDSTYGMFVSNVKTPINNILPENARQAVQKEYSYIDLNDPTIKKRISEYRLTLNLETNVYKPIARFRNNYISISTPPSGLGNKFFKILSFSDSAIKGYDEYCWYKIVMQDENNEIVTWLMHSNSSQDFKIYIKGYTEKLKSKYINQTLYLKKESWNQKDFTNALDKKTYTYVPEKKFTCVDMTFVLTDGVKYPDLAFILKSEDNIEIAVYPARRYRNDNSLAVSDFWNEKEYIAYKETEKKMQDSLLAKQKADEFRKRKAEKEFRNDLIKEYGKELGNLIADGKVRLGMTKDMCEAAWGWPSNKSKAAVGSNVVEIWFYSGDRWLKFVNNKLTQITN